MPRGKPNTPREVTGTPEAPLYKKDAPEVVKTPAHSEAPAAPVKVVPVPVQADMPPEPKEDGAVPITPSIRDALEEELDKKPPPAPQGEEAPPPSQEATPPTGDKVGAPAAPKEEARSAEKPEPAKSEDAMARLRADLAAKTRNEQWILREKAALEADLVAAREEAEELAKAAQEVASAEDIAAIRRNWASRRSVRTEGNDTARIGSDIDFFLSSAGYARSESEPGAFAPHPVVDAIAQVFQRDPRRAWELAYGEWRQTQPQPGSGTVTQPSSPRVAGATNAGPKTYTEEEVRRRVEETEKRARDVVRNEALQAASTASLPGGVVGRDLDAEFWKLEPAEKIRAGLIESQKGR